jgi:ABC-type uncharacterized transport system substrate-binding protein
MTRREFIAFLGAAASSPLAARAQTKQMRRIGVLMGLVANDPEASSDGSRDATSRSSIAGLGTEMCATTLRSCSPWRPRVALVFNPQSAPFADLFLRPVEAAAPSFSVAPIGAPVRDPADVDRVFDALAREPNGGLMVLPDISMTNYREAIVALAARHRVRAIYPYRYFTASGGLMSYGTDSVEVFRRAAGYVDRILKGTSPGELPIQAPNKYELVINLKTAKALGLEVPDSLLARADEVIE